MFQGCQEFEGTSQVPTVSITSCTWAPCPSFPKPWYKLNSTSGSWGRKAQPDPTPEVFRNLSSRWMNNVNDNVCCVCETGFLIAAIFNWIATLNQLMQEISVSESILSLGVQTLFDILSGHTYYGAVQQITLTLCVSSAHDRGVENALLGHGTKPPTANKNLTDFNI